VWLRLRRDVQIVEQRIEVTPSNAIAEMAKWYLPTEHQLITVVALDTGSQLELQWIFSAYGKLNDRTVFRAYFDYSALIPTLTRYIPSAWIIEREIVDLFGVQIEGTQPGLMLDSDSIQAPLRKNK